MSDGRVGLGAKFQMSSSASAVSGYYTFAELMDVDSPAPEYAAIEVTSMDSTGAKEFIPATLAEGGEFEAMMIYDSATGTKLNGLLRLRRAYRVKYAGSSCHRFKGYLLAWNLSAPVEDKMTCKAKIKVVSMPSFSATSTVA